MSKLSPYVSPGITTAKEIHYAAIGRATIKYFQLSWKEVNSTCRKKELVYCRQMMIYLMRTHTAMTLKQIAAVFNKIEYDHTTILHHIECFKGKLKLYQDVRDDVNAILNIL